MDMGEKKNNNHIFLYIFKKKIHHIIRKKENQKTEIGAFQKNAKPKLNDKEI